MKYYIMSVYYVVFTNNVQQKREKAVARREIIIRQELFPMVSLLEKADFLFSYKKSKLEKSSLPKVCILLFILKEEDSFFSINNPLTFHLACLHILLHP